MQSWFKTHSVLLSGNVIPELVLICRKFLQIKSVLRRVKVSQPCWQMPAIPSHRQWCQDNTQSFTARLVYRAQPSLEHTNYSHKYLSVIHFSCFYFKHQFIHRWLIMICVYMYIGSINSIYISIYRERW